MLNKWKLIINNWMNCYFNDGNKHKDGVNLESLINIISHLRENFNLDESKSSLIEAHTVEEFIQEKYSAFKFENGTVEATNEDELYLVASLLLLFVCVNSKDVDIKNAMCSRLSGEDQEIILKFSKSLMQCSPVTCRDVQAAITDACGLEMATIEMSPSNVTVAETPPALRSLHGEVRRLQAALDAERFDRNYLQEELARTNLRIEKLLKDKEQHKLEIVNLKAKISMCCGQEDVDRSAETRAENSAKLAKQLQEMEERLVHTQEQLDDVTYERDTFKAKLEELKQDRDKWLSLSQQESARASELAEELETERRHVVSLRELVGELRQHNRLNRLDSSQLECDDPDASIHSLQHNLSVCSEACANVVEVQLGEERAKIVVLKQQIQNLQDQINELTQKSETEKQTYEEILSDRENEIFNLKHRINEEIEEKNNLKAHFNDEVTKLNNEMNELEQKLKDNNNNSRQVIEQKMRDIQTLQEEKLSLLQSLSDETTKLETIIQELKADINNEKQSKLNMKESYENHLMKLNEKVLNRNNELVELQNNISQKSELIESLHLDLRKEREHKEDITNKYHNDMYQMNEFKNQLEDNLQKKTQEMFIMQQNFEQRVTLILNEVEYFKTMASSLQEQCQNLDETKEKLQAEMNTSIMKLDEVEKEIENIKNTFSEERERLKRDMDEKNATISTLQTHLQDEIHYKIGLQEELQKLQANKVTLNEELSNLNSLLLKFKTELAEKDKTIEGINLCLQEEKFTTEKMKIENVKLVEQIQKIHQDNTEKDNNIECLKNQLETVKRTLENDICNKEDIIQKINDKLSSEVLEKEELRDKVNTLNNEIAKLETTLVKKCNGISQLQSECEKLTQIIQDNKKKIQHLENDVETEKKKCEQLEQNFDSETTKMFVKLNETEKTIKELSANSTKALTVKDQEIKSLVNEIDGLRNALESNNNSVVLLSKEKQALLDKLNEEIAYKNKFEKEYHNQCALLVSTTTQLNAEFGRKNEEIDTSKIELEAAMKTIWEKSEEIRSLERTLSQEIDSRRELVYQKEIEIKDLKTKLNDQESLNDELELELKKAVDGRQITIDALQTQNEQLHFTIEEDNSNHEVIVKEKDKIIDRLEQEIKQQSVQLEFIRKDYEDVTLSWEKYKMEARENMETKEEQIRKLREQFATNERNLKEGERIKVELYEKIENIVKEKDDIEQRSRNEISKLMESLELDETKYVAIVHEKSNIEKQLYEEKAAKDTLESEKVQMSDTLKTLFSDKRELLNNKTVLEQQLLEEKSIRAIIEKEKELIEEKLMKNVELMNTILEEKECLEQQLNEEKTSKEIIEKEKVLTEQKLIETTETLSTLLKDKELLSQQLEEETTAKEQIQTEKVLLGEEFVKNAEVINTLLKEKECLKQQLNEEKTSKEFLEKEKVLTEEKIIKNTEVLNTLLNENEHHSQQLKKEMTAKELIHAEKELVEEKLVKITQAFNALLEEKEHLSQQLKEEMTAKELMQKEKLLTKEKLIKNTEALGTLLEEKEHLSQQLKEEIMAKELMQTEKEFIEEKVVQNTEVINTLLQEKEHLSQQLKEEMTAKELVQKEKVLTKEKLIQSTESLNTLLKQKEHLSQQLEEQKIANKSIEREKELTKENLFKTTEILNTLLEEKTHLTKQLKEEKTAKDLKQKENENILSAKQLLEEKLVKESNNKVELNNEFYKITQKQVSQEEAYKVEKTELVQELQTEKSAKEAIIQEMGCLITEHESLKHEIIERKAAQEMLTNDKHLLIVENEALMKSLDEEKALHSEIGRENNKLSEKLNELNEKYATEINEKHIELAKVTADIAHLRMDYKNKEELNRQISSTLSDGIQKLVRILKKEDITNEVLQKLTEIENKDIPATDQCDLLINIANTLTNELTMRKNLEKQENIVLMELREVIQQKEMQVFELQTEVKRLQQVIKDNKLELSKQIATHNTTIENNAREMHSLRQENQSLINDLNDVKLQLEIKVHSLKEKLIDNENWTEKLKRTYEAQIENLNVMITKLTSYLKDKTIEIESARKEKERLQQLVEQNNKVIMSLEDELKSEKQNEEKLISDFESERQVLKNMVTVTESVMEDQKVTLNKVISEHIKANELLQEQNRSMRELAENERKNFELKLKEKESALESVFRELAELRLKNEKIVKDLDLKKEEYDGEITKLNKELTNKLTRIDALELENKNLTTALKKCKDDIEALEKQYSDLKIEKEELKVEKDAVENILQIEKHKLQEELERDLKEKTQNNLELQEEAKLLTDQIDVSAKDKQELEVQKSELVTKLNELQLKLNSNKLHDSEEMIILKKDNMHLVNIIEENKTVITNLELLIKHELEQNQQLREDTTHEKLDLANKCSVLRDHYTKAEQQLEEKQNEIVSLQKEIKALQTQVQICEKDLKAKDGFISKISKDKDAVISTISKELLQEKAINEKYQKELEANTVTIGELRKNLDDLNNLREALEILRKENEELIKAIGQRETFAVQDKASSHKTSNQTERELRDLHHQVDNTSSDITHSSLESLKTITDLEKIIHDKNRIITTLQSDVTYLKTLMAESETKLLDVTKELEVSKETCQQLSSQLKKLVQQKNEEIVELKKQVSKMSVTENRATQIIKVSAKYQAIILKRIAEIKSNTVLKELTNFGNSNNCDNELRRSLNSGSITMEDLENFLETTDRHLKRCSEKQIALQKERDRLIEVNRINESEIINLKKFLTELSVCFQTFSSIKDLYSQKLSRIISVQRTVRREILNLDGRITDACMCKLERGYAAVMQDLSECAMNLQRWVERSIGRSISPEKIKQAFMTDVERTSLAPTSFQNAGLEVQLEELDNSFQKLLEEVTCAQKGEGAKDAQAVTVLEVRAEYEDKLNRMKAKMKQLYTEQIAVFKEKQREEIALLERELQKARDKLTESSKAYEDHIRGLTTELWSVGEKFLMKKDEAEWLRRKQRSGSLMSLQHVHSSGLLPPQEEPSRPSDTHSLRSLPVNNNNTSKREGRGMHMSDEEGEVFDNRWLQELAATPRRDRGKRLSELQWRNSLCPPHLKSSYPAETQFAPALDEEHIKCAGTLGMSGVRQQRKEVGITAYKKPGPPTPSKQAGRLSATDSELRESLRVEADPQAAPRKTSTPSRIRALFRSAKNDTTEGTPRSRRLSNIFRKK